VLTSATVLSGHGMRDKASACIALASPMLKSKIKLMHTHAHRASLPYGLSEFKMERQAM